MCLYYVGHGFVSMSPLRISSRCRENIWVVNGFFLIIVYLCIMLGLLVFIFVMCLGFWLFVCSCMACVFYI